MHTPASPLYQHLKLKQLIRVIKLAKTPNDVLSILDKKSIDKGQGSPYNIPNINNKPLTEIQNGHYQNQNFTSHK